jgi:hypothetical protein
VSAERARLDKILIVRGGRVQETNKLEYMGSYVKLIGPDGTGHPLDRKAVSPSDARNTIYVDRGANLLMKYGKQEAWLDYDTCVRIEQDWLKVEKGRVYVLKKGLLCTDKLAVQSLSEYYLEVKEDEPDTLYVVEGKVQARNVRTGVSKIIPESKGIDESLNEIALSEEKVREILMWRGQLTLPISWPAHIIHCLKRYWWAPVVGGIAAVMVKEIVSPCPAQRECPRCSAQGTIRIDVVWPE